MRRASTFTLALLLLEASGLAQDFVDTDLLGRRGVAFESPTGKDGFRHGTGVGDFNGDGFDDIGLMVREHDFNADHPWALHLIYGRAGFTGRHDLRDGVPESFVLRVGDPAIQGRIEAEGKEIAPLGDVNADGYADFIFSFPHYGSFADSTASGRCFLLYGAEGLAGEAAVEDIGRGLPGVVFETSHPDHGSIGWVMKNAGDFNGDGTEDLAISAPSSDVPGHPGDAGVVFVLFDTPSLAGLVDLGDVGTRIPGVVFKGFSRFRQSIGRLLGAHIGKELAAAGDFDGDGFDDILLGAEGLAPPAVYLVYGREWTSGVVDLSILSGADEGILEENRIVEFRGPTEGGPWSFAQRGHFAALGDVNGDGLPDIAVSVAMGCCALFNPTNSVVQVFFGQPDFPARVSFENVRSQNTFPAALGVAVLPRTEHTRFGQGIAPAGDLDGDGMPDFAIGAPRVTVAQKAEAGEAYVVFGRRDFAPELSLRGPFEGLRIVGERPFDMLGRYLAPAGDFNGDGTDDVLVLSARQVNQRIEAELPLSARAYVIYGPGPEGPPLGLVRIEPPSGVVSGGTEVRIRGSGFHGAPAVRFGDRPAGSVVVVSESEILAVTPSARDPGPVDIVVTVDGETRRLERAFSYLAFPPTDLGDIEGRGVLIEGEVDHIFGGALVLGDLTGDGIDELVSSATAANWAEEKTTALTVLQGRADLPTPLRGLEPSADVSLVWFHSDSTGMSLGMVGDVNADGYDDLGVGFSGAFGYLLFGRAEFARETDIDSELALGGAVRLDRGEFSAGLVFARAGDMTGDGIDDFAVGFPQAPLSFDPDPGSFQVGEVLLVEGRRAWSRTLDLLDHWFRFFGVPGDPPMGDRVLEVGDVNGDGIGDLLVGTTTDFSHPARAYLIYGWRESDRQRAASLAFPDPSETGRGVVIQLEDGIRNLPRYRMARAGDVNGDGYNDLFLGVEGGGVSNQGVSYLLYGGPSLPERIRIEENPSTPDGVVRIIGDQAPLQTAKVAPAGDVDADGYDDLLIAATIGVPPDPGHLFLIFGGSALPERIDLAAVGPFGLRIEGIVDLGGVLVSPSGTGDVNGDGVADFAFREAGHPDAPGHPAVPGHVYVVYGVPRLTAFVRGDSDLSGSVNLSDAVATFSHLFAGGGPLPCEDAADADDDGGLTLSDGVFLLGHLFVDGPPPPPPFPGPGYDPTEDGLGCRP